MKRRILDIGRTPTGLRISLQELADNNFVARGYELMEVEFNELEHIADDLQFLLSRANLVGEMGLAASDEVVRLAMLLFDALVPPTLKPLLRRGDGALTLRLEDGLQHLPWELLHNGNDFLARQYALSRELNPLGIGEPPPVRALDADTPRRVLIIADPRDDLPAAAREGALLREAFEDRSDVELGFMVSDVTRAEVRESLREYDIVHLAGHAEWDDSGGGWLLSDGRFEPVDVQRLGGTRALPTLVFANGCSSGATARPDVDGMSRALLQAGVRASIGTLWDIPDDIGILFAVALYRRLLEGQPVGEAVRCTRIDLAKKFGDGTALWGSYVLYGEPSQAFFQKQPDILPDLTEEAMPGRRLIKPPPSPIAPNPTLRGAQGMARLSDAAELSPLQLQALRMQRATMLAISVCILAVAFLAVAFYSRSDSPDSVPTGGKDPTAPDPQGPAALMLPDSEIEVEPIEPAAELGLKVDLLAQLRDAQGHLRELPLKRGDLLHSGDRVRLFFESNQDAYAYVFFVDGRSRAQLVFPRVDGDVGEVSGGLPVALPQSDGWYWLDDVAGTNAFIVALNDEPIDSVPLLVNDIRDLLQETGAHSAHDQVTGLTVDSESSETKDAPPDVSPPSGPALRTLPLELVRERIAREAAVVEVFEIDHRP